MSQKTTGLEQTETEGTQVSLWGIVAGTEIMTLSGALPVEFLDAGDRVVTRDRGAVTLKRVFSQPVTSPLVKVACGALGHDRPDRPLFLLPRQKLLIRDWRARALYGAAQALVPVSKLIDGQYVTLTPARSLRLVTLEFDSAHVLYAGGVELEAPARVRA
ncbi:hypothetical protein AQS8620_01864 [Aquimixticola soesokkakensis]|uniref:Hedgehog/Intein (Hint) domain-containing protein n=1 Tax=Aquimixticola soesokkakensis TaxID=1519096 RepID=A0A1Y5SRZ1_9RHOB|nr:Hint domain-containing protein [Aquimixticola soesokkakensis]SLN45585.1 hypothetical protein AQS8620_01864 [Aquimixticola soesokkakensis]